MKNKQIQNTILDNCFNIYLRAHMMETYYKNHPEKCLCDVFIERLHNIRTEAHQISEMLPCCKPDNAWYKATLEETIKTLNIVTKLYIVNNLPCPSFVHTKAKTKHSRQDSNLRIED